MSKLSTWIGFRMNCSYLQKLLSHVISCKITWSFRQNKQILVWFQKLTDLCIFMIQNFIIKQVLKPLWKSHYLLNKQLPPLFYFFVQVGILVPTKPESDQCHCNHLRNKAFYVRVTKSAFHIHTDIFIFKPTVLIIFRNYSCQWWVLYIHYIHTCYAQRNCVLDSFNQTLSLTRLTQT
jgi:hypothetical protein